MREAELSERRTLRQRLREGGTRAHAELIAGEIELSQLQLFARAAQRLGEHRAALIAEAVAVQRELCK